MDDESPPPSPPRSFRPLNSTQRLERAIALLESGIVRMALDDIRKRHGREAAEVMKRRLLNAALASVS